MARGIQAVDRRGQVLMFPEPHPGAVILVGAALLFMAGWFLATAPAPKGAGLYPQLPKPPPMPVRLYMPKRVTGPALFSGGSLHAPTAGVLDATVLAHTLNLGADGPRVPIALGFSRDGAAIPASALGLGVVVGQTRSAVVPKGAAVSVVTAARYGRYGALEDDVYVRSDLPGGFVDAATPRALMLRNGDVVPYARRIGYGGQPSLAEILAARVGPGGRLVLPDNQAIVTYEYTTHFHSPAADFQDLVVLLTFTPEK